MEIKTKECKLFHSLPIKGDNTQLTIYWKDECNGNESEQKVLCNTATGGWPGTAFNQNAQISSSHGLEQCKIRGAVK